MPNKEGGYGGYRKPEGGSQPRRVRTAAPPPVPPREEHDLPDFENTEWISPPPGANPPAVPEPAAGPQPQAPRRTVTRMQPREGIPRPPMTPAQTRAAARRARQRRRKQQRLLLACTALGILLLAGIITLLLPKSAKTDPVTSVSLDKPTVGGKLVAPLPYEGSGGTAALAPDWGTVGPAPQNADSGYTYTAAPARPDSVPELGRVTTEWFADAAFLGDSLTAGFTEYGIDLGGALVCGYEGISPNAIVNRTTVTHPDRGEEVALDVLAAAQPAKLYVLMGTNALGGTGNDEGFLNYYARMLDDLQAALPNTTVFVQSVLPVRPDVLEKFPGLSSDRLASINEAIRQLCAERGCLFLDLNAEFSDENGDLDAEFAQNDGIHLTVSGYAKWVSFLCTHLPYDRDNPYQPGSTYYLDDSIRALLDDLP